MPDWNPDFSWKMEPKSGGGHFHELHKEGGAAVGTWEVTKGMLVITMTNASWPDYSIPVESYQVVHIDDHEMVLLQAGADKYQTAHKK